MRQIFKYKIRQGLTVDIFFEISLRNFVMSRQKVRNLFFFYEFEKCLPSIVPIFITILKNLEKACQERDFRVPDTVKIGRSCSNQDSVSVEKKSIMESNVLVEQHMPFGKSADV